MWGAATLMVLACVVPVGCGHLGYEAVPDRDAGVPDAAAVDAGTDAASDAATDASVDAGDAATDGGDEDGGALGPFGPPVLIEELSRAGANDDDPSLTADLLEIYFKSDRGGQADPDLYRATRAGPDQPWRNPVRVDELSTSGYEGTPEVSADGLVLYFSSNRAGGLGAADLWRSTRAHREDPWGAPTHVPELSSASDDWALVVDATETLCVLGSTRSGNMDLFRASRAGVGLAWDAPTAITELNTAGYEADAMLDPAGLVLVFVADAPGGAGARDIWSTHRPDPGSPFEAARNLEEVNGLHNDEDPWMSPDGRVLAFARDAGGDQDLYLATR